MRRLVPALLLGFAAALLAGCGDSKTTATQAAPAGKPGQLPAPPPIKKA